MQLSGGEQQMLAIGRALLGNPRLLIMDEPSEGLAPTIIETLIETFQSLARDGLAILVVEQNLAVATAMAERQLVMVAGRIFAETTAAKIAADPDLQRRFLGVERALMATVVLVGTLDTKGMSTASCATGSRRRASTSCSWTAGFSASRRSRRMWAGRTSPRPRAPTSPRCARAGDRGAAVDAMGAAPRRCSRDLQQRAGGRRRRGRWLRQFVDRGAGDAGLPVGVPKLIVSTMASGDARPYVGAVDVTMTYSVVDISGINQISRADPQQRRGRGRGHGDGAVPERSGERP